MAPTALQRALFRAPIGLFRARLGWVFGGALLMLVCVGRSSGATRRSVLEVVKHDKGSDDYFVVAGYGRSSDWYRNALATPPLLVAVGSRRFVPVVHELDEDERFDLLTDYQRRNPKVASSLGARLLGQDFSDDPAAIRALAVELGALRLSDAGR